MIVLLVFFFVMAEDAVCKHLFLMTEGKRV